MNFEEIRDLLEKLLALGIKISTNGDRLKIDAPQGVMTDEITQSIKQHKIALLEYSNLVHIQSDLQIPTDSFSAPLPLNQIRIYELQKSAANKNRFNIPTIFQINGPLDHKRFIRCFEYAIRNNRIFNTVIDDSGNYPSFLFFEKLKKIELTKLSSNSTDRQLIKRKLKSYLRKKIDFDFQLNRENPWYAELLEINKNSYFFIFTCHHIIFDGLSKKIFLEEINSIYNNDTHDFKKISFLDYATWVSNQELRVATKNYWEKQLFQPIETIILPADKDSLNTPDSSNLSNIVFNFSDSIFNKIKEITTNHNCNVFNIILSAMAVTINKYSHQQKFCIVSPFANRQVKEFTDTVGYFNTILPIFFDFYEVRSPKELLLRTRKNLLDALDFQDITLSELTEFQSLKKVSLSKIMVTVQDSFDDSLNLMNCKTLSIKTRRSSSDFDMALYFEIQDGGIKLSFDYNNHMFSKRIVNQFVQSFANNLSFLNDVNIPNFDSIPSPTPSYQQIEKEILALNEIDDCKLIFDYAIQGLVLYLVLNEHLNYDIKRLREFYSSSFPKHLFPKSFITLDKLPRSSDGSVEIKNLPIVSYTRSHLSNKFKAPETELQDKLCLIWKDVLWLNFEPGIHDHFVELGGHSLLAVHLVTSIQSRLSINLSNQALSRLSTIEQMEQDILFSSNRQSNRVPYLNHLLPSDVYHGLKKYTSTWQGYRDNEDSVMVGLNINGTLQPIYWCLQRYYELTQLAKYLGPDQPVYGMRSGNLVMEKNDENIQNLAKFYAEEILQSSTENHFILGGNCQAAVIAFHIAKHLKSMGKTIDLLILHEKFISAPYDDRVALMFGHKSSYHPKFSYEFPMIGWRKYYKGYLSFNSVAGGHGEFFTEPNIQSLSTTIQSEIALAKNNSYEGNVVIDQLPAVVEHPPQFTIEIFPSNLSCAPGTKITLSAKLINLSNKPLLKWNHSGLAIIGRWISKANNSTNWHHIDGYHRLTEEIKPHSEELFSITLQAPKTPGAYSFMYDLAEEGISWLTASTKTKSIDIAVQ